MKGLSLTLTVIVVAVALLVTVLVIITIFGGQMANFLGLLNPWSEDVLATSMCNSKCATWCQANPGESGEAWGNVGQIKYKGTDQDCSGLVSKLGLSSRCTCGFSSGCQVSYACTATDMGKKVKRPNANCGTGKTCEITCPRAGTTADAEAKVYSGSCVDQ